VDTAGSGRKLVTRDNNDGDDDDNNSWGDGILFSGAV
jgi:hypothetical protein